MKIDKTLNNRAVAIAAIVVIVAFISLFVGYHIGADMARTENASDAGLKQETF